MLPARKLFPGTAICLLIAGTLTADEWPFYAGNAARTSIAARGPRDLDTTRWSVAPGADEEYVWRSAPVVHSGRVFVNSRLFIDSVHENNLVIAYDVDDGHRRWTTPIEYDLLDSWASPAVDVRNETVLLGSGYNVYALDMATGTVEWQTPLERKIVNASPVISSDLFNYGTPANRAFITDYGSYASGGKLYAINVDPFDAADNPYHPGDVVWTADMPTTSGATPAYADGVVVAAGYTRVEVEPFVYIYPGEMRAFDAASATQLWAKDVAGDDGFFGGVTIRNGFVYAATYDFLGSGNNSRVLKLDLTDGDIIWSVPSERTDSIPIVTDDGRIYLSAGIEGFGSAIKIQAFQDTGDSAAQLWDTYVDTGGDLIVGGYTHQPAWARGYLYAGTPPVEGGSNYGPHTDLYVLDAAKTPGDPGFIVAHHAGSGASPAVADGTLYSFGQDGLFAFEPSPACLADLDGDGIVGLSDLAGLLGAYGTSRGDADFDSDADLNRDGTVDLDDLAALLGAYGVACP